MHYITLFSSKISLVLHSDVVTLEMGGPQNYRMGLLSSCFSAFPAQCRKTSGKAMFSTKLRDTMLFISSNFWQLVRLPVCMSVCSPLAWSQCVKCDFSYRHSNARNNNNSEPEGLKSRDDTEQSLCTQIVCGFVIIIIIIKVCPWPFAEEPHFKRYIWQRGQNIYFCFFVFHCWRR